MRQYVSPHIITGESDAIDSPDARWYMDAAYPSMIAHYLYKLGMIHGHAKIQYTLLSMVSEPIAYGTDRRIYLSASSRSCRGT
jgi:hypothetical protein